jgi:hypothetical protein
MRRIDLIPINEAWTFGFAARQPLVLEKGREDFVTFSEPYTKRHGQPVWFYGWGNVMWLRCPAVFFVRATIRRSVDFAHGFGWMWEIEY